MSDYSLHAQIDCIDGHGGTVTATIFDPATQRITHLVVRTGMFGGSERLVPIEHVSTASPHGIQLLCTRDELCHMELFVDTQYVPSGADMQDIVPAGIAPYAPIAAEPFPTNPGYYTVETEHIPRGELAVRRGARVRASDGGAGTVEDFVVATATGAITHLVIKTGWLFHHEKLALPVTAIERMTADEVVLKIDKQAVAALPDAPGN